MSYADEKSIDKQGSIVPTCGEWSHDGHQGRNQHRKGKHILASESQRQKSTWNLY